MAYKQVAFVGLKHLKHAFEDLDFRILVILCPKHLLFLTPKSIHLLMKLFVVGVVFVLQWV